MPIDLDWSVVWRSPHGEVVLRAILTTIKLSLISWVFALLIGTLAGIARGSPNRFVRFVATVHVEIFRNIPLLIQLFFAYYVLPRLLPMEWRQELFNLGWEMGSANLTLSLYTSAKVAEHVRAGTLAVDNQIKIAALSTGLTWRQAQIYVVAPLILRLITPNLTSEFVTVFKSSSIALAVGVMETSYVTQQLGLDTFRWIETNTLATVVYLSCAWTVAIFMSTISDTRAFPDCCGVERWTDADRP